MAGLWGIVQGDARERLAEMPSGSVQTVCTSPPYYGLRDYGVAGQIGLEASPAAYVERLVGVMREVRRVLRDDGTLWLVLGDSYAGSWGNYSGQGRGNGGQRPITVGSLPSPAWDGRERERPAASRKLDGLKEKDLLMIPARVALALQADGWWLRSAIIWSKPNPMPESVTDRPTTAHEHVFLLSKAATYYYDSTAIAEPAIHAGKVVTLGEKSLSRGQQNANGLAHWGNGAAESVTVGSSRNRRSVWTISTQPYPGAHFAVFPERLVEPCILAGSSARGCCPACGAGWVRVVEREGEARQKFYSGANQHGADNRRMMRNGQFFSRSETTGWRPGCSCDAGEPVPCLVLDPFMGSGTTLLVATKLGRRSLGIELKEDYIRLAERRLAGVQIRMELAR